MLDFIRIGCAVPEVCVGDVKENARRICEDMARADEKGCDVVVFPELALTGYSCGDLFFQQALHRAVKAGLEQIVACSGRYPALTAVVGLPVNIDGRLFNCAAVIGKGELRGLVPKTFLPEHASASEKRWFASARDLKRTSLEARELGIDGWYTVPVGAGQVFALAEGAMLGVEVCEDLFAPAPPSVGLALGGAEVIVNPAASPQIPGRHSFRRELVRHQSRVCRSVYCFCSAGYTESHTDLVYSGQSILAQQGRVLAENEKLTDSGYLLVADADLGAVRSARCRDTSFRDAMAMDPAVPGVRPYECFGEELRGDGKLYPVSPQPFDTTPETCREIFQIQVTGLARRLQLLNAKAVIGVSGGLDSTLALLVAVEAMSRLGRPASDVCAVTLPGAGTSDRTYRNACRLMELLGVTVKQIPIGDAVALHFRDIGHDPAVLDGTYENAQARERTQILMDYASVVGGIVVGTGDLSELALGWCTYNGDHMSMYGVNASVPKTLIGPVIRTVSEEPAFVGARAVLEDILDTPISPELLPADRSGEIAQKTEDLIGPYALHDFFLYYMVGCDFSPAKIHALACRAFEGIYSQQEVKKWLKVFCHRFFTQQFKRSCMPEGVKAWDISLSPRGGWSMPGDASAKLWLEEIDRL